MGSSSLFLASPNEASAMLAWFRALEQPPHETLTGDGAVLFFKELGGLVDLEKDDRRARLFGQAVDTDRSPLVSVVLPSVRRNVFWTVGEVHFLPTPLKQRFPALAAVRRKFLKRLQAEALVFETHPKGVHDWDYYLEGTSRNRGDIYALPKAFAALKAGQYFVSHHESENLLTKVCQTLRLRGIDCT